MRSLASIRNLDMFVTIAVGYIALISEKADEKRIVLELIAISKRIFETPKFVLYAIADGLFEILSKTNKGIADMLCKKPKPIQLSLFPNTGFAWVG